MSRQRHDSDSGSDDAEAPPRTSRAGDTIYRDKHGRVVAAEDVEDERARRERLRNERRAQDREWAKGSAQERERRALSSEEHASRPFAGSIDDKELNDMQRRKMLWDDPALQFSATASSSRGGADAHGGDAKQVYRGPWPANRFNIPPGYRWDGVDRSNRFEEKYFLETNRKKALKDAAYKWSTEDM